MRLEDIDALSDEQLRSVVIKALAECPNQSCVKDTLTSRVAKLLGISTLRGTRRDNFEKRLNRITGMLKRAGYVEEYKATNVRLRLLKGSDVLAQKQLSKIVSTLDELEAQLLKGAISSEQFHQLRTKLLAQAISK